MRSVEITSITPLQINVPNLYKSMFPTQYIFLGFKGHTMSTKRLHVPLKLMVWPQDPGLSVSEAAVYIRHKCMQAEGGKRRLI